MNRHAWTFDLLVLGVLLMVATFLQDSSGLVAWGHAKPPFLISVAVYYGLRRPVWLAGLAAFGAGLLLDGLGGRVVGSATTVMLWFFAVCVGWARRQMSESMPSCLLLACGCAVGMSLYQSGCLRWLGGGRMEGVMLLVRALLHGLVALPVCAVTVFAAAALDRFASNVQMENHGDGFDWSGNRL